MSRRAWLLLSCLPLAGACSKSQLAGSPAQGGAGGESGAGPSVIQLAPWPGPAEVTALEDPAQFGANLSGLTYEPARSDAPSTLWAVTNIPGKLYRLLEDGAGFAPDAGWESGKLLSYPGGRGEADAEGITLAATLADGLYVVAEHDNTAAQVSRISVLRYDPDAPGAALSATHEWDLTLAVPPLDANRGLEAITWVPDDYLVERGFFDEQSGRAYEPADYPAHGAGLFFVGVEQTGVIHGFALDHDAGAATRIASVVTRYPGVIGLEYDRDARQLWAWCDDLCGNQASVFDLEHDDVETPGRFRERAWLERPRGLPNSNNEGIAIGAERECEEGLKPFFWADDNDVNGQSLRRGWVTCGAQ